MDSPLQLEVFEDFQSSAHLEPEWDEAVQRLDGPIYMTFGWLRVWWEFYGERRKLRVLVFRSEDGVVRALIPLYLDRLPIMAPFRLKVARLVGANVPPKTFDPPVDPAWMGQVFGHLLEAVFAKESCDLLSLGPISDLWPAREAFEKAGQAATASGFCVECEPRDVRTVFRLPASFEEYLASLEPGERKGRMKRMRQLERQAAITDDIVSDPEALSAEFDRFSTMHARQWEMIGKGGHFQAWPKALDYNRALVATHAGHGRVRFYRLLADGEPIASRYTFALGKTLYSELPARATGQPWDKLGVGVSSLIRFKGQAIASGFSMVDSGLGAYDHKSGVGGDEVKVRITRIFRGSLGQRLKARWGLLISRLVLTFCRKIWYRRIVPRLPTRFVRTQSLSWLRFDF